MVYHFESFIIEYIVRAVFFAEDDGFGIALIIFSMFQNLDVPNVARKINIVFFI